MPQPGDKPLLVGVDGGATEVKAHAVVAVSGGLAAGEEHAAFRHVLVPGFTPVPIDVQRRERESGRLVIGDLERVQSERWIDSFADAILSVAARAGRTDVWLGVCTPGLKSRDGRGVEVVRNGPRLVGFLDRLESRLALEGLDVVASIPPLLSDGHACGLGELAHPEGGFRGVSNAYYVGGGTGVAECLLLDGRVTSFDEVESRAEKAWNLRSTSGRTFEDHLSMRGLESRFVEASAQGAPGAADARRTERTAAERIAAEPGRAQHGDTQHGHTERGHAEREYVEHAAARGDAAAIATLQECGARLGELVEARARVFPIERVVVGQRLGALLADPTVSRFLRPPLERATSIPIRASTLRAAPAVGAARRALDARAESAARARSTTRG